MNAIQAACVLLLLVGIALRRRAGPLAEWGRDAPWVFAGAWLGEHSCIVAYDFYRYDPGWHGWLGHVPVLIPTIWVFVVLSARDVARRLAGAGKSWLPWVLPLIWYDALLIEPVATHAHLWRWSEAGPWNVPWIGTLGWTLYGTAALGWLERLPRNRRWLVVFLAPLSTHVLLLALWWGALRWFGRSAPEPVALAVGAWLVAAGIGLGWLRSGRLASVPVAWLWPRMPPAGFFFALLAVAGAPWALWAYAGAFALPWLLVVRWRGGRSALAVAAVVLACGFPALAGAGEPLSDPAVAVIGVTPPPQEAPPTSAAPAGFAPATYLGLTLGLPLPVGGVFGLAVNRRLDARNFADLGVGTAAVLSGIYVSWGHLMTPGSFFLLGLDANLFAGFGDLLTLPGVHAGYGWEWIDANSRYALAIACGYPWLGGLRLTVGL